MSTLTIQVISRPSVDLRAWADKAKDNQLTGTPAENLIEFAGRTCYDSLGTGRSSKDYHAHLLEVGHGSVLEHAYFSFLVGGVSRGLTHELIRHRAGTAVSQRSTRYVDESHSPWVVHPLLENFLEDQQYDKGSRRNIAETLKLLTIDAQDLYADIVHVLSEWQAQRGVDKFTARKQARGAARGVLGNALSTELVWSANVRAIRNVIEQRGHPAADAEIREFAVTLLRIVRPECPAYFDDYRILPSPDGIGEIVETPYRKV